MMMMQANMAQMAEVSEARRGEAGRGVPSLVPPGTLSFCGAGTDTCRGEMHLTHPLSPFDPLGHPHPPRSLTVPSSDHTLSPPSPRRLPPPPVRFPTSPPRPLCADTASDAATRDASSVTPALPPTRRRGWSSATRPVRTARRARTRNAPRVMSVQRLSLANRQDRVDFSASTRTVPTLPVPSDTKTRTGIQSHRQLSPPPKPQRTPRSRRRHQKLKLRSRSRTLPGQITRMGTVTSRWSCRAEVSWMVLSTTPGQISPAGTARGVRDQTASSPTQLPGSHRNLEDRTHLEEAQAEHSGSGRRTAWAVERGM
jgi:hypothetical protein